MHALIIYLAFVAVWAAANIAYASWKWNRGTCRKNGLPWRAFDIDSHGETGYVAGEETWWNGWPVFDWPNVKDEPRRSMARLVRKHEA
jgi:hypothetical protein